MNPFRHAFTRSIRNPKYVITAFCFNYIFSLGSYWLLPYIKNAYLSVALSTFLHALVLLITLTLAVNIHRGKSFSFGSLARLPRTAPLFLLCYTILSSAALVSLSLIRRASVLYALMTLSTFLGFAVPLLVIALAIMTLLWLHLYTAFCAHGVPHALKNAFLMLKHPLAFPRVYIHLFWILFLIGSVGLWITSMFEFGIYFSCALTALLAPFTALLTLSYCDTLCQRYHPHLPRF